MSGWTVLQPSGGQPDAKAENFGKDSDFGRPGQPVELVPVFVPLASQEASFINGEVYGVPGGKGRCMISRDVQQATNTLSVRTGVSFAVQRLRF